MKLPHTSFSIALCTAYLSYWSMHFTRHAGFFGMQFRFLTHWGFTFAVLTKISKLLLGDKCLRIRALLSVLSGTINLIIFIMYWSAVFANPAFFVSQFQMPLWHNIILHDIMLHAFSPLAEIVLSLKKPKAHTTKQEFVAVNSFLIIYTLWLECLVRPFGVLPYPQLQAASMGGCMAYYTIAFIISNILLCTFQFVRDCWHRHDAIEKACSATSVIGMPADSLCKKVQAVRAEAYFCEKTEYSGGCTFEKLKATKTGRFSCL